MSNTTRLLVLAGATLSFGSVALADGIDTDQVRATVREMLADADTRSSLLEGGGTGGHNGRNFYLASGDGNFVMNFFAYTQMRYTASFAQNVNGGSSRAAPAIPANNDSFDSGFSNNLTVFGIFGNFCSPSWEYVVSMAMSDNTGGGAALYDGYITYKMDNNFKSRFGQFKPTFLREASLGDTTLMAANRSVLESAFGQGRSQGIALMWASDQFSAGFEFNDGFRQANTNWNNNAEADFCFGGNLRWRFAGTDDQLNDYTSMPGDAFGGTVGGAVFWQQGSNNPAAAVNSQGDFISYTIDGQIEGGGFGLYAGVVGATTNLRATAPAVDNFQNWGAAVQGSWRFTKEWEVFARCDWIQLDTAQFANGLKDNFLVTAGLNYYIAGHAAKVTLDGIVALNNTQSLANTAIVPNAGGNILNGANGIGLLGSTKGAETAIRLQFQGAF